MTMLPHVPEPPRHAAPPAWRVIGTFVLGALGISFSAIFVRVALPAPPVVTAFYRILFALPVLALVAWAQGPRARASRRERLGAPLAGLALGTDLALWHMAIVSTSVANATLLVNTTPVPVGLWAAWVLRERPSRGFVAGAALALAGTALLLGLDRGSGAHLRGDALALCASLFYASYLIGMKRVRRGLDAARATLGASLGAVLITGCYALLRGDPFTGFPARSWWAFLGVALVSQVCGVLGIAWALRWLRATFASVTLLIQPLGTALLGWLLLGEALAPLQAAGGAAVLAGILLASRTALDPDPEGAGAAARS